MTKRKMTKLQERAYRAPWSNSTVGLLRNLKDLGGGRFVGLSLNK